MKKQRLPFGKHLSQPMTEMEQEGAKDLFAQQAHQKQSEIELNLGNGKKVSFTLVVIQPEDIERKTSVFRGNGRIQEALNAFTLRDLIPSIRKHGMTFPAIGRQLPDGTYEALDGSRRRATCIITKQPYYIYITNSTLIDEKTARYLSEIGNVYKQLSQYEQGKQYVVQIDKGVSPVEVARQEGITKTKVYQARDAYLLPKEFYHAHASGFDLGRPRINAYRTMWAKALELKFDHDLLAFLKGLDPEQLAANIDVSEVGTVRAINEAKALLLKQNELVDEEQFNQVSACQNLAQLMEFPEMVELLGLSDAVIRAIDNAARKEIKEAFDALSPAPEPTAANDPVFEGRHVTVTRAIVKDGVRMTFRKVSTEQQLAIEKMISDYLSESEQSDETDTE